MKSLVLVFILVTGVMVFPSLLLHSTGLVAGETRQPQQRPLEKLLKQLDDDDELERRQIVVLPPTVNDEATIRRLKSEIIDLRAENDALKLTIKYLEQELGKLIGNND